MPPTLTESPPTTAPAPFCGLRMTADEFFNIPDDGYNYELLDGVVILAPNSTPSHQWITVELIRQIANFLTSQPVGKALIETDVHLGKGPTGQDLVYRPEIVFFRSERLAGMSRRLHGAPDLAVEIISEGTRLYDTRTKRDDYERCGVHEYWIVDPGRQSITFYRLIEGKYQQLKPSGQSFTSEAVPGFQLDLARICEAMKPWE